MTEGGWLTVGWIDQPSANALVTASDLPNRVKGSVWPFAVARSGVCWTSFRQIRAPSERPDGVELRPLQAGFSGAGTGPRPCLRAAALLVLRRGASAPPPHWIGIRPVSLGCHALTVDGDAAVYLDARASVSSTGQWLSTVCTSLRRVSGSAGCPTRSRDDFLITRRDCGIHAEQPRRSKWPHRLTLTLVRGTP